jgi:hypothetical protein
MFLPISSPSFIDDLHRLIGATIRGLASSHGNFPDLPADVIDHASTQEPMLVQIGTKNGRRFTFDEGLWKFAKIGETKILLVKTTTHANLFPNDPPLTKYEITLR